MDAERQPEDQPPMADQTSGTSAIAEGARLSAQQPHIQHISSSLELSKGRTVVLPEEPSTGAWNGGAYAEQELGARMSKLEAAVDQQNKRLVTLPGDIMAHITCMETRLRARIEELFHQCAASTVALTEALKAQSPVTPKHGRGSNVDGGQRADVMLKNVLLSNTSLPGTSARGRKRSGGEEREQAKTRQDSRKRESSRRLFSPARGQTNADTRDDGDVLEIPPWIAVAFNPTKDMKLDVTDVAVVAYAWALDHDNLLPSEVVVEHDFIHGTRAMMQAIAPGGKLGDDVINMVAAMMTHEERSIPGNAIRWWLPTHFSQYALTAERDARTVGGFYMEPFMGHSECLVKVFIPMHDIGPDHWYLLVIDMVRRELVYLDSKLSQGRKLSRERHIRKVAIFFEEMLEDRAFHKRSDFVVPNVASYPIVCPSSISQQSNGVDCGVWVCRWMILAEHWGRYNIGDVDNQARVRLLVDLIRKPYNRISRQVTDRARTFMEDTGTFPPQKLA